MGSKVREGTEIYDEYGIIRWPTELQVDDRGKRNKQKGAIVQKIQAELGQKLQVSYDINNDASGYLIEDSTSLRYFTTPFNIDTLDRKLFYVLMNQTTGNKDKHYHYARRIKLPSNERLRYDEEFVLKKVSNSNSSGAVKERVSNSSGFYIEYRNEFQNGSKSGKTLETCPVYRLGSTSFFVPFDYKILKPIVKANIKDTDQFATFLWTFMKTEDSTEQTSLVKKYEANLLTNILIPIDNVRTYENYPLHWILTTFDENKEQKPLLDLKYYNENVNSMTKKTETKTKTKTTEERNKEICKDDLKLFEHQEFVSYCLRPYSPIRSLIINSITGSGKTRMMQSVLENFASYPNLKIVLFPKHEIRDKFYNDNILRYSAEYYPFPETTHINRLDSIVKRRSRKKPDLENLDAFNLKFTGKPTAKNPIQLSSFDEYVDLRKSVKDPEFKPKHQGSTLVLTYSQFVVFCEIMLNSTTQKVEFKKGARPLFDTKTNELDLGGAMILVDEAHLLVDPDSTNEDAKQVRKILESQRSKIHTIGLFTATPGDNLCLYKDLLKCSVDNGKKEQFIRNNHMMLFDRSMGNKQPGMFNTEKWTFTDVESSPLLQERSDPLSTRKDGTLFHNRWNLDPDYTSSAPILRYRHCWLTMSDWLDLKSNDEKFIDSSTYTEKVTDMSKAHEFFLHLPRELEGVRQWDEKKILQILSVRKSVGKRTEKEMKKVAEWLLDFFDINHSMIDQEKLVADLPYYDTTKGKNQTAFDILFFLYPKLHAVLDVFLDDHYQRERDMIHYETIQRIVDDLVENASNYNLVTNKSKWDTPFQNTRKGIFGPKHEPKVSYHDQFVRLRMQVYEDYPKLELADKTLKIENDKRRIDNIENRSVIMLGFDDGLGMLAKILTNLKIPHIISQVEGSAKDRYRPQTHPQIYLGPDLKKSKSITANQKDGFYLDTFLTDYYNSHRESMPVMIYNSYRPEGVDLFYTTNMHILSTEMSTFEQLEQMVGRINRLCHTTNEGKNIVFYYPENISPVLSSMSESQKVEHKNQTMDVTQSQTVKETNELNNSDNNGKEHIRSRKK
jgi:hypothetical protein